MFLSQALLSMNIADAFSFDCLRNKPDRVSDFISALLTQASSVGQDMARKAGEAWVSDNPTEPVFLCLNCGARAVSRDRGICMGCGFEGDEEIARLLEDFSATEQEIANPEERLGAAGKLRQPTW
jgi:hypothetical protein